MNLYLKHLLALFLGIIIVLVGLNYIVDPYRIFHKPWVRDNYYLNDHSMRVEASGIVKNEEFDSIILGNSESENFSAYQASQVLKANYVNISMNGSSMIERTFVLNYALQQKNIKQVIFQLEGMSPNTKLLSDTPIGPYSFLYDQYAMNDLLFYMINIKNSRYLLCTNMLFSIDSVCKHKTKKLDSLVEWGSNPDHYNRFGGLNKWINAMNSVPIQYSFKSILKSRNKINANQVKKIDITKTHYHREKYKQFIEKDMLNLVKQNPNTEFYLFFPPYSRVKYAIAQQSEPQTFENYKEIIRLIVDDFGQFPNVKVFGFEREGFLDDIANYNDIIHYHPRYNQAILGWMKMGKHQLTMSNLNEYLEDIAEKSKKYPLKEFANKIDCYLNNPNQLMCTQ